MYSRQFLTEKATILPMTLHGETMALGIYKKLLP